MKLISFTQAKQIKKMSLNDMNRWVAAIYKSGFEDGLREGEDISDDCVCQISEDNMKEIIMSVGKIGEDLADSIVSAILDVGFEYPQSL